MIQILKQAANQVANALANRLILFIDNSGELNLKDENGNVRKVLTDADEVGGGALAYKVYSALLTQSGTNDPVATVLENTLGFTPEILRFDTGWYYFDCPGYDFSTHYFIVQNKRIYNYEVGVDRYFDIMLPLDPGSNQINLRSRKISDDLLTDDFADLFFELRIYEK